MITPDEILIEPLFEGIYNKKHEDELLRNLRLKKPTFENWRYMVGLMSFYGINKKKQMEYFDKYCKSQTYNHKDTIRFISNHPQYKFEVLSGRIIDKDILTDSTSVRPSSYLPQIKPTAFTKGIDVINHFFSHTYPVLPMKVPDDNIEAAHYYYKLGYTPLPKHPVDKHPGVLYSNDAAGIHYRDNRYPESQIDAWKWEHGVYLLGDHNFCYLDIDHHPEKGVDGTQWLDDHLMRLIHSRHYERSQSDGYHVYGIGDLRPVSQIEGIEIKGNTNGIVAYPSKGYRVNSYI